MGNQNLFQNLDAQIKPKACCGSPLVFITNSTIDTCDITCSICFEIYRSPRIMKCKYFLYKRRHTLCTQCISQWGKKPTATCPFCRTVLKKNKGNFGRVDKITEKKIESLVIKCRGCTWNGSVKKYIENFDANPSIDDGVMPQERIHEEGIQKQAENQQQKTSKEHKKETGAKNSELITSTSIPEEKQKQPKQLNYLITPAELSVNNPFGDDLFLREYEDSPIFRYFNIENMSNWRERDWDDGFMLDRYDDIWGLNQVTQSGYLDPLRESVEVRRGAERQFE